MQTCNKQIVTTILNPYKAKSWTNFWKEAYTVYSTIYSMVLLNCCRFYLLLYKSTEHSCVIKVPVAKTFKLIHVCWKSYRYEYQGFNSILAAFAETPYCKHQHLNLATCAGPEWFKSQDLVEIDWKRVQRERERAGCEGVGESMVMWYLSWRDAITDIDREVVDTGARA
jgi:hypothetical protein